MSRRALPELERREKLRVLETKLPNCTDCSLCKNRTCTVVGYYPEEHMPRIVLLGEAPGKEEDMSGEPFVGKSGQILNVMLKHNQIPRSKLGLLNVTKCRPPSNRNPNKNEIKECLKYLIEQIECLRPMVIVAMGVVAAETILQCKVKITQERGKLLMHQYPDGKMCIVLPTLHPSAILHNPSWRGMLEEDIRQISKMTTIQRHIAQYDCIREDTPWLPILQEKP